MFHKLTLVLVLVVLVSDGLQGQDKGKEQALTRIVDSKSFFKKFKGLLDFEDAKAGEVVNNKYAKQGVVFESSNTKKDVSAHMYRFNGGLGGMLCIASQEPTYQGKLTVNFDVGPNKGVGVSQVGFHLAHVSKNGTVVEVYGKDKALLGKLAVDKSSQGTAFIGFESKKPVMSLLIVPNPKIDEDFALDDLAFKAWKK